MQKTKQKIKPRLDGVEESSIRTDIDQMSAIVDEATKNQSPDLIESSSVAEPRTDTSVSVTSESSSSSTASNNTAKELEMKVRKLKNELVQKKSEADRLRQALKAKEAREKSKLREEEEFLRKKINSYDSLIDKIKAALDSEEKLKETPKETSTNKRVQHKEVNESSIQTEAQELTESSPHSESPSKSSQLRSKSEENIRTEQESKLSSRSSSSLSSAESSRKNSKYDEDFVTSEAPSNRPATSTSALRPSTEPEKPSAKTELEEKSTASEISEEIIDEATKKRSTYESSSESSSSSDTQLLNLASKSNRIEPPKQDSTETKSEDDLSDEESASLADAKVDEEDDMKGRVVDSIEQMIVQQSIEQMINVRQTKRLKLVEEEQRCPQRQDSEPGFYLDDQEETDFKVHVPSIDLREEDEPNQTRSSLKLEEQKEALRLKQLKIPYRKEKIEELTDLAIEGYFCRRLERNDSLLISSQEDERITEDVLLADYFKHNETIKAETESEKESLKQIQTTFKKMLLDLIGELMHDLYLERYEQPKPVSSFFPGIKKNPRKLIFKSRLKGPANISDTQKLLKTKVNQLLKLDNNNNTNNDDKLNPANDWRALATRRSKWRTQKKLDLVDSLLDNEMREQEHEWANYSEMYFLEFFIQTTTTLHIE